MQIEHTESQWVIIPETQKEDDALYLILPLIKKYTPDFLCWIGNVISRALFENHQDTLSSRQ